MVIGTTYHVFSTHRHIAASVHIAQGFYSPELSDEVIAHAMRSEFHISAVEPTYGLPDYRVLVLDNVLCYHPSVDPAIIESLKITL